MFTSQEGKKVPQVAPSTPRQGDQWIDVTTDDLFKKQNRHCFLAAGRVHADLNFFEPPAALQRTVQRIQAARRRQHSLRLRERHLRVMNAWKADQHAETSPSCRTATVNHQRHGTCWSRKRTWALALVHGATRCWCATAWSRKMFCRAEQAGRTRLKCPTPTPCWKYLAPEFKVQESVSLFTKPGCPFLRQSQTDAARARHFR